MDADSIGSAGLTRSEMNLASPQSGQQNLPGAQISSERPTRPFQSGISDTRITTNRRRYLTLKTDDIAILFCVPDRENNGEAGRILRNQNAFVHS